MKIHSRTPIKPRRDGPAPRGFLAGRADPGRATGV
jgi:hypothetical protein